MDKRKLTAGRFSITLSSMAMLIVLFVAIAFIILQAMDVNLQNASSLFYIANVASVFTFTLKPVFAILILVFCGALCLMFLISGIKIFLNKSTQKLKSSLIVNIVAQSFLLAYFLAVFIFLLVYIIQHGEAIKMLFGVTFYIMLGVSLVMAILGVICISVVSNCFNIGRYGHGKSDDLYFYSSLYEQVDGREKYSTDFAVSQKKQQKKQEVKVDLKEKGTSKQLVLNVMKLEELKKQGKISAKEYTKLRQKLISRYK